MSFKCYLIVNYVLLLITTTTTFEQNSIEPGNEYCQFETFSPKCSSNEIVMIQNALFGRMKKGKCITEEEIKTSGSFIHDPKYFGCSIDVTSTLHERCSFKQECNFKLSDPELKKTTPCLLGLVLYLEVDYKCLEVFQLESSNCLLSLSTKAKYFVSENLQNTNCGRMNNPWIIEAPKGQRLTTEIVKKQKMSCNYADIYLFDEFERKNISLCEENYQTGSSSIRPFKSFKSFSNLVKMYTRNLDHTMERFLIKFQADGCLDIIPPEDTWLKRTNDDIVIGCYSSKQTWYLRCENNKWTGSIGNCSQNNINLNDKYGDSKVTVQKKDIMPKHQQILTIVSIFGVGVVICSLIICAGAVCAKRYSTIKKGGQLKLSVNAYEQTYNHKIYQHDFPDNLRKNHFDPPLISESMPNPLMANDKTYFVLEDDKKFVNE